MNTTAEMTARDFGDYLRALKMRDVGGPLTEGEKTGMAGMGEYWVLTLVNPETLSPVEGKAKPYRAIIYSAFGMDVLDGRHRRAAAREEGVDTISAWVGLDQAQYAQWKDTGDWNQQTPTLQKPRGPGR